MKQKPPHGGGLVGLFFWGRFGGAFNSRSARFTTYFINFLYYIRAKKIK